MDIEPLYAPAHSFKDIAIEVFIVTVGIMIAFGLEGIREIMHENHEVRDARAVFRSELLSDKQNLEQEMASVKVTNQQIDSFLADLPDLKKNPDQLAARVGKINPSFYFFGVSAWESGLSSGALSHMKTAEVMRYADAYENLRKYGEIQGQALPIYFSMESSLRARKSFHDEELRKGEEQMRIFQMYERVLAHFGEEVTQAVKAALGQP